MEKSTILFLCPYGGAKSVIAASYFNRLAEKQSLPYVGVAAAAEEPYDAVPAPVAGLLERDGFDVRSFKPHHVAAADVKAATKIVTIDCNITEVDVAGTAVERWDDVPKVSVDLDASAAAIRRHVEALVAELPKRR
jgi:protein-tyrosine-phosphatase